MTLIEADLIRRGVLPREYAADADRLDAAVSAHHRATVRALADPEDAAAAAATIMRGAGATNRASLNLPTR